MRTHRRDAPHVRVHRRPRPLVRGGARLPDRGLAVLLDALTAIGLLEKADARGRTVPELAPYLSAREARSLLPLALHSVNLWDRWSRLTEVVAGSRPGGGDPDARTRAFIGAMNAIAAPQADGIVAAVATRAALVQLSVPPLAALGGVAVLGETVTLRLGLSAAVILGGIALAVTGRRA